MAHASSAGAVCTSVCAREPAVEGHQRSALTICMQRS
jgi:hypothetical protein